MVEQSHGCETGVKAPIGALISSVIVGSVHVGLQREVVAKVQICTLPPVSEQHVELSSHLPSCGCDECAGGLTITRALRSDFLALLATVEHLPESTTTTRRAR
jgi:hypothetical protein